MPWKPRNAQIKKDNNIVRSKILCKTILKVKKLTSPEWAVGGREYLLFLPLHVEKLDGVAQVDRRVRRTGEKSSYNNMNFAWVYSYEN